MTSLFALLPKRNKTTRNSFVGTFIIAVSQKTQQAEILKFLNAEKFGVSIC